MARLRLREGLLGDYHLFPVYELDFENMVEEIPDAFQIDNSRYTGSANDGKEPITIDAATEVELRLQSFEVQSVDLWKYLPANIPRAKVRYGKVPDSQIKGAICSFNTNNEPNTTYPAEVYGWQTVTETPTDLNTNYRYGTYWKTNQSGTPNSEYRPQRAIPVGGIYSPEANLVYYKDVNNTTIHQFYTGVGSCHFSVAKMNSLSYYGQSLSYYAPILTVGYIPTFVQGWNRLTEAQKLTYTFCNKNNYSLGDKTGLSGKQYHYILEGNTAGAQVDWNNRNWWQFFVHYSLNGQDFYGIAVCKYTTSYSDEDYPLSIRVIALDARFWGEAVYPGESGEGQWTNDGTISHVQGGQGSFSAPSDNHGDGQGHAAKTNAATWSGNNAPFDQGFNKYFLSSPDAAAFKQMVDKLVNPSVWEGFDNKYYNPIDSIITCAMIPALFAPTGSEVGSQSVIKASNLNLSTNTVNTFNIWNKSIHIGRVNISDYTDAFADFDNTTIYINLPYVGVKQLDINACMDGELSVDYLIDYLTQDITAQIWTKDKFGNYNIRYEFKGNCGKQVPLTQVVPRSTQVMGGINQALIPIAAGAAVGVVGGLVSGIGAASTAAYVAGSSTNPSKLFAIGQGIKEGAKGFGSTFGSTMKTLGTTGTTFGTASSAMNAIGASQQMTSSNANGGAVSSPVNTQCYILITRPMWSAPEEYGKQFGYPSDISGTINMSDTELGEPFTNFLSVRSILLNNIPCTVEERNEIENLMKAGVYVSND